MKGWWAAAGFFWGEKKGRRLGEIFRNLREKEPGSESFPAVEDSLPWKKESYLERRAARVYP